MAIGFFFVGRVLSKTGTAYARLLEVLFKDNDNIPHTLKVRYYDAGNLSAEVDHCYLFSGNAILREGEPPKLNALNIVKIELDESALPSCSIEMSSTVTLSKGATEPDSGGLCFFDGILSEWDGDAQKNITVSSDPLMPCYFHVLHSTAA
jgi:hypothetical protein